ncbi:universal stress protein [Bowdeniella nasicola]|uniref:Universal stress protein n=1 Tax=Bowdeniella nasicola TaxID=208480 RepID=A0A1Q5Q4N7_9ACTO|nr:universal stress protein [Bowdeniella nasicola]OKL54753.1 universal stress protein [Bowdeniella nasicola]
MTHEPVVLVGVDGSPAALGAVDWAVAHAKRLGWRLHIVCAYALPSFPATSIDGGYAALDDTQIHNGAQQVLHEAVQRAGDGLEVTSALENGDPTAVLVELSKQAGLVVIGSHKGSGFTDRLLGAVSSALPAHSHCPTIVVPLREEGKEPLIPIRRIVVGVDGSESAKGALHQAVREASLWEAEITAIAAVAIASAAGTLAWMPATVDRDRILADVREGLDVAIEGATAGFPEVRVRRHALDGNAAALLAEFSTAVDLVVVGTRGRGGFAGLMLGSTSQALLQHSVCPVMVVPSKFDAEERSPTELWQHR